MAPVHDQQSLNLVDRYRSWLTLYTAVVRMHVKVNLQYCGHDILLSCITRSSSSTNSNVSSMTSHRLLHLGHVTW